MFDEKLTALKSELIEYAALVEGMIGKSVRGLIEREDGVLIEVIEEQEPKANETEIRIDELCTTAIAQYQPMAKDLRSVLMILKINNDLERVADHAVNISEAALFLSDHPPVKPLVDIPRMADETVSMLRDSITAFINEDAKMASSVCIRDNTVDALADQILRELITFMSSEPRTIDRSLRLLSISGNLERIADLSTNICEDVIFMVEGRVIKHHADRCL
jgi:phosphate transport system protein